MEHPVGQRCLAGFLLLDALLPMTTAMLLLLIVQVGMGVPRVPLTIYWACTTRGALYVYYLVPASLKACVSGCVHSHFTNENPQWDQISFLREYYWQTVELGSEHSFG